MIALPFNGFGQEAQPDVTTLGYPSYVGINLGPDGQPYYKVVDDYVTAVAGALNSFRVDLSGSPDVDPTKTTQMTFEASRVAGVGDLAAAVAQQREGGPLAGSGVFVKGDVLADDVVVVRLSNFIDDNLDGGYVLVDPNAGWRLRGGPGTNWLGTQIKRAGLGLQWGALIGGGVAITIIGLHAMRSRKRGG
jgi:hypothetical protein